MSSLDVESVSVLSGLELVNFLDSLVGLLDPLNSLDTVGAGESGLDSGMGSVCSLSLTSVTVG